VHGHTAAFKRHNVREDRSNSKNILRVPIINAVSASAGTYPRAWKKALVIHNSTGSELEKGKSVAD